MMASAEDADAATAPRDTATNADLAVRLRPDALIAGRYRILTQLGLGGMGVVYRARDEELRLEVALKVLRPDLGTAPEWVERFRRELVLAREVTHKNVVRIHDIGESDGLRFLTMRLVEGRSLGEVIARDGPLPAPRAIRVLRQVAEALCEAHHAGIVHRDLKPGNILIAPDDTAYVTDFGIARALENDGFTKTGAVVGTLDYLSPEQADGRPIDARSDIYSLGIVLFEMLTGQLPFPTHPWAESVARRISGRPRDIAETGVLVPLHVRAVIYRCLEPAPARRYPSTAELIADLDAKRIGQVWLRRRRRPVLVAAGVLVLASGTGYWLIRAIPTAPAVDGASAGAVPAALSEVAVLPLLDETGDPSLAWTSAGIAEILAGHLAEAPQLRVVDPARVMLILRDLKLDRAFTHDEATLKRLAEVLGVRRVVTGSLRRAGSALRLDLRLVSAGGPGGGPTRAIGAEAQESRGLFRLVADLGEKLRDELGVSREPGAPAPEPPTASLEAAQAYREGSERLARGDSVGAAPALERAVAADPQFAAAQLALGEAYQVLGYQDKATAAVERAAAATAGMESRLAWRARARLALLRGDPADAERTSAELARRYPNDTQALLELAAAQESQGAVAEAVRTLKRVTELDRGDPRAFFLLGKNMILAGDARQAVTDPLVHALALMTQVGSVQGQGDVLNAMGVAHQRLGEYAEAAKRYGEASAIRRQAGDERGATVSLANRAGIHLALGRFAEAEPDLRAARATYTRIGDRKGLAAVLTEIGTLHEGRGEYAAAQKAYQQSLRIRRDLGDEHLLAQSYDNVGYIFFLEGEHDNALVYWRQALELRQKVGDKAGIVLSTQNLGFLEIAQGRWPEAMKSFLDALQKAREIEFANAQAVSHGNIGLLHQLEGRYGAGLAAYDEAIVILRRLGDERGLAEYTIKKAACLIEQGRLDEAKADLDTATSWVSATGNREQASDLQVALGVWHLARREAEPTREALARAVELANASRSRAAILRSRIARASGLISLGDAAAAAPDLAFSVREADALGEKLLQVRAREAQARASLARGQLRAAEQAAAQALQTAERCGFEAGLFRLYALLGRIRDRAGDRAGAAKAFGESAVRMARLRDALPAELRPAFERAAAVAVEGAFAPPRTAAR